MTHDINEAAVGVSKTKLDIDWRPVVLLRGIIASVAVMALIAGNPSPANADVFDGIQLYYGFENDTQLAGGILDHSGNNRNGSATDVSGGTVDYVFDTDVAGAIGTGFSIRANGTDEILADSPGYDGVLGSASRTVAAWVKVDPNVADTVNMHIVEWGLNGTGERWTVRRMNNNGGGTALDVGSLRTEVSGDFRVGQGQSMNDGQWHHVASVLTEDVVGGTTVQDVTMYFDGTAFASYTDGGSPDPINTAAGEIVHIGGGASTAVREWNGWLDEVGIWNRALTASEVGELAAGATLPVPEPSSLTLIGLGLLGLISRRRKS